MLGTEFHRAPPWEDFAVAEKWRGGLSRGCAKPRDGEGEPGTRLGGDEGPPGRSPHSAWRGCRGGGVSPEATAFPGPYLTLLACWRGQGGLPTEVINAVKQTYREPPTLVDSWLLMYPHCLPHPGSTLLIVKVFQHGPRHLRDSQNMFVDLGW